MMHKKILKSTKFKTFVPLIACGLVSFSAQAIILPVNEDVTINSASPGFANGLAPLLHVDSTRSTLLGFNYGAIPSNVSSDQVAKATLNLWVNTVKGSVTNNLNFYTLPSTWSELNIDEIRAIPLLSQGSLIATLPLYSLLANNWVQIDVTNMVQAYLANPTLNMSGIYIQTGGNTSNANITIDSKENAGTAHSAWIDLELVGQSGRQGPMGLQGQVGPQGVAGPIGQTGPQGPIGPVGPAGPQGPVGQTGPTGAQGAVGPIGPIGPQGSQGPVGPQGPIGATGPQGLTGNTGDPGPRGPQGAEGPTGPQGQAGLDGATGPQGPQGAMGPQGATGVVSVASINGTIGTIYANEPGFTFHGPTATVTLTSSQRITATMSAALQASTTTSIDIDLCYQPINGGAVTEFVGNAYQVVDVSPNRLPFSFSQTVVIGAPGSYQVGFCTKNPTNSNISGNDWIVGWVMVSN